MSSLILKLDNISFSYRQRHSFFRSNNHKVINQLTLNIYQGDRIGIIGRNGVGKSTLLRIMAGVNSPDEGSVKHYSEHISLLSLQAGFDPQLTGWDNALFGCVLNGMSVKKAKTKLDEIHEFSELGDQMNEPLKTYSSGMKARLGFGVVAVNDVDLLLIDEVLSVGDINFREKCKKTVEEKIENGCSIVVVSHSMGKLKTWTDQVYDFGVDNEKTILLPID